jgi:hypothetical protein
MEPDDLLCSRNARPEKALVGRAQWKINQPPSLRDNKRAWRENLKPRSTAAVGSTRVPFQEREANELRRIIYIARRAQ